MPGGSSIQGQSQVGVWNAQPKAVRVPSPTATGSDGTANFATDINSNLLVGVALHKLTHAMGRVPYGTGVDPQGRPDIFDLFRFTSPGTRLFTGSASSAPAAYFSLNGGSTKFADYGRTSDTSDFLNSGVQGGNDPFNEFYTSSTTQQLSTADLLQLDALGFHLTGFAPAAVELGAATTYRSSVDNYYLYPVGNPPGAAPAALCRRGRHGRSVWPLVADRRRAQLKWRLFSRLEDVGRRSIHRVDHRRQRQLHLADAFRHVSQLVRTIARTEFRPGPQQRREARPGHDERRDGRLDHGGQGRNSYFLYAVGGSSGPQLRYAGAYAAAGQFSPGRRSVRSTMQVAAIQLSGRCRAPTNTPCGPPTAAAITSRRSSVVTSASWYVQSLEQSFGQDLNSDGRIGPVTTNIETAGSTTVAKVADSYFLYPTGSSGPQLRYAGAYVAAGQFGAWTALGAEHNGGGYQVAWKNGPADQYTTWTTDGSGNYLRQAPCCREPALRWNRLRRLSIRISTVTGRPVLSRR